MSLSSTEHETKVLNLHLYKAKMVHKLCNPDHEARWNFVSGNFMRCMLEKETPDFLFSDEAWCHFSGYVNSQNDRYWSPEIAALIHKVPLHEVTVCEWCAVSGSRITASSFF